MDKPLEKIVRFSTFSNLCFYSIEWVVFYPEPHKILLQSLFGQKKGEENFTFLTKGRDFGTKSDFPFSQIDVSIV